VGVSFCVFIHPILLQFHSFCQKSNSFVTGRNPLISKPYFIDLRSFDEKEDALKKSLASRNENVYLPALSELRELPFGAFGYQAPNSVLKAFKNYKKIGENIAYFPSGGLDAPAEEYYRYHWEVTSNQIGSKSRYAPFWNGGVGFSPFYATLLNVLLWKYDGSIVASDPRSNIRLREYYFEPGVAWGKRNQWLNVCQQEKVVFSKEGQQVFPYKEEDTWKLIAFLNSQLARYSINLYCGQHKTGGYVGHLPLSRDAFNSSSGLGNYAQIAYNLKSSWDMGGEISPRFVKPWLLQLSQPENDAFAQGLGRVLELLGDNAPEIALPGPVTLEALLDAARAIEQAADECLQHLQAKIDKTVYEFYEISPQDRELIERKLGDRPPVLVWPQMNGKSDREKREEHVKRFVYYFALQAVREDEDGLVPLVGCAAREPYLMDRVRAKLEEIFGPTTAYDLEQEAAEHIGRDVEKQLHTYFFHHFHTGLYKNRPILWHLTSNKKYFAVMIDYHRLDRDTLPKMRSLYLWPQMESVRTRLAAARAEQNVSLTGELEEELADLKDFEGST
jgi:hypothetical protein